MLSFLTDTCEQLAEGAVHNVCQMAAANPMVTLGVTAATLLTASAGLYFGCRNPAAKVEAPKVPVARLARASFADTVKQTTVNQKELAELVDAAPSVMRRMPVQSIVVAELKSRLATDANAKALLMRRQTEAATIDKQVLGELGLPVDGTMPKTQAGLANYDAIMTRLNLGEQAAEKVQGPGVQVLADVTKSPKPF